MGRDFWKNFGVLIGAVLSSAVVSAMIVWGMIEWAGLSHGDSARLFQAVGAVTVIFVGGVFAYWRFQIFRTFQPHLTISHEVSHRLVGDNYVHIAVTASLHNSSRVKVELREAFFSLQGIAPTTNEDVERLYTEMFVNRDRTSLQWPILNLIEREWLENELIIEPGGLHQETCEFIVATGTESVMIYTYFYNPIAPTSGQAAEGWYATTVYDVIGGD